MLFYTIREQKSHRKNEENTFQGKLRKISQISSKFINFFKNIKHNLNHISLASTPYTLIKHPLYIFRTKLKINKSYIPTRYKPFGTEVEKHCVFCKVINTFSYILLKNIRLRVLICSVPSIHFLQQFMWTGTFTGMYKNLKWILCNSRKAIWKCASAFVDSMNMNNFDLTRPIQFTEANQLL